MKTIIESSTLRLRLAPNSKAVVKDRVVYLHYKVIKECNTDTHSPYAWIKTELGSSHLVLETVQQIAEMQIQAELAVQAINAAYRKPYGESISENLTGAGR